MHVDDLASAILFLLEINFSGNLINIGSGSDIEIKQLADKIRKIIRYKGNFKFDVSKPDGTPKKLLDISRRSNITPGH